MPYSTRQLRAMGSKLYDLRVRQGVGASILRFYSRNRRFPAIIAP